VDFKPETSEEERLKIDVLKVHKRYIDESLNHMPEDKPAGTEPKHYYKPIFEDRSEGTEPIHYCYKPILEDKSEGTCPIHYCRECGQMFKSQEYIMKHKCQTNMDSDTDEPFPFTPLLHTSMEENDAKWEQTFEKYKEEYDEEKAMAKATKELLQDDVEYFTENYAQHIVQNMEFNQSPIHRKIMDRTKEFVQIGIPLDTAVNASLKENEDIIRYIVNTSERYDDSSSDSSSETDCDN
jgi:hypothetical protein